MNNLNKIDMICDLLHLNYLHGVAVGSWSIIHCQRYFLKAHDIAVKYDISTPVENLKGGGVLKFLRDGEELEDKIEQELSKKILEGE